MNLIGFDFGTTNSLIAQVQKNSAIHFLDEDGLPTPSVVCYEGEQKILGRAAKLRVAQSGLGIQGNLVTSPKSFLGKESVFVGGIEKSPTEIVSDIVEHILDEARKSSLKQHVPLSDVSGAVVTIPVDMQGYARQALRNSFMRAGVRIYQFVHEPFAALYGYFRENPDLLSRYDNKMILVIDWGGGTLDITLCKLKNSTLFQLGNGGTDEVGGNSFDEAILNFVLKKVCSERYINNPTEELGARARLFDQCERAKIDLSLRTNAHIFVPGYFRGLEDNDLDLMITRDEFENITSSLIDNSFFRISKILENANYSTEQISLCLVTGGMANMPAIRSRMHEIFGPSRTAIPHNTATIVAEGAAWIAEDKTGLMLAKNIELEQARGSYIPLIKAKMILPKEGEVNKSSFHMYCTDSRDGIAKFQFCTPHRFGSVMSSEPRKSLANITIKVDHKAKAFSERLDLDMQINDNLILEIRATSLNVNDTDFCEIHDLEFALDLPLHNAGGAGCSDGYNDLAKSDISHSDIVIKARANVAESVDQRLVPGEFLYSYNPTYFDVRLNPPEEQVYEKLYYTPCAKCGRRSNDPACKC